MAIAAIAAVALLATRRETAPTPSAAARRDAVRPGEAAPAALVVLGRVVFPPGIPDVPVGIEMIDGAGEPIGFAATAGDGSYRIEGPAGRAAALVVSAGGLPPAVARIDSRSGDVTIDVVLAPGTSLNVAVRDDAGSPVPGAVVVPEPLDPDLTDGERRALARAGSRRTDGSGAAVLSIHPAAPTAISARADGHVPARTDPLEAPAPRSLEMELPRAGSLSGPVDRLDGSPAAGAIVRVVGSGLWPSAEFVADAAGRFATGPIPPGFYEVEAADGDAVSPLARGVEVLPGSARDLRLATAPGGRVAGRVTAHHDGRPAAGAAVTLHGAQPRLVPQRVSAGEDGRFVFGPLLPGRYVVRASSAPLLDAEARADVQAGDVATLDLVLREGRTLAGRVLGPDGAPVGRAEVVVAGTSDDGTYVFRSSATDEMAALHVGKDASAGRLLPIGELGVMEGPLPPIPPRPSGWPDAPAEATPRTAHAARPPSGLATDPQGRFSCRGLPPGSFDVTVLHPEFAPATAPVAISAAGPDATVEIRLEAGCSLSGAVRDEDGAPVTGASVWVSAGAPLPPRAARSDESGAFRVEHLAPRVTIRVLAAGFAEAAMEAAMTGTPCAGVEEIALVRLGGSVRGRVIDRRRLPVAGAAVRVERPGGDARWAGQRTVTGRDGGFSLPAPRGGALLVAASHPDYLEATVAVEPGESVEVVLDAGVRVFGTVADDAGATPAATVTLLHNGEVVGVRPADAATGAFDLGRTAPGTYEVRATAAGFADASVLVGVDEPPGAVSDPAVRVDLRLRRGVALAGRVVDRFGEPVADADVEAARAGSRLAPRRARTGPDGRFEIGGLDPGRYRVEASHDDLGTATTDATLDVGAPGRPVELAFARAVPARASPEGAADRIAYSVVNDAVIVSRPAAGTGPGADVLLAGDVIVQVERERIRDVETLRAVLSRVRRATVSVAVERSGRRRFLAVDREAMLAQGW